MPGGPLFVQKQTQNAIHAARKMRARFLSVFVIGDGFNVDDNFE
jgi:hypothetical protein